MVVRLTVHRHFNRVLFVHKGPRIVSAFVKPDRKRPLLFNRRAQSEATELGRHPNGQPYPSTAENVAGRYNRIIKNDLLADNFCLPRLRVD
jgi:hypothetical protein